MFTMKFDNARSFMLERELRGRYIEHSTAGPKRNGQEDMLSQLLLLLLSGG